MTEATAAKYDNRLSKTLVAKGGMSASQAIEAATAAVELVRDPTINQMDAWLEEIYAGAAALEAYEDEPLRALYIAANRVVAVAGVFDLADLGQAAYSLCELITRFQEQERFSKPMTAVHVDGLKLLRKAADHSPEHRKAVLEGLLKISSSF